MAMGSNLVVEALALRNPLVGFKIFKNIRFLLISQFKSSV